jgi:uncharacterized membrane protein
MNNKITNIILLLIVIIAFAIGTFYYPQFPAKIASHWGASGEANGYMGKFWGIFLMPLIMLVMLAVYLIIPLIDPLKSNIKEFRKYYNGFWVLIELFFLYIFSLTIIYNLGYTFNFTYAILPAMSALFFFIGSFLQKVKRNYFIGIRTPWTLSSDIVWDKTHKLGGRLFQISAIISLLGLFVSGDAMILVLLLPILLATVITIVYSYLEYKKLK